MKNYKCFDGAAVTVDWLSHLAIKTSFISAHIFQAFEGYFKAKQGWAF